jgi:hypothetical protein
MLNQEKCGITINGNTYNVFCYADDILIASTTPTGLQNLIDLSVQYINRHGLRFNPTKTVCLTYGRPTFTQLPQWNIEGANLSVEDGVVYLGAGLSHDNGLTHAERRILATTRAFHCLLVRRLSQKIVQFGTKAPYLVHRYLK